MRFLLLQIRNAEDPMRSQEVRCFARGLECAPGQIDVHDLLVDAPCRSRLREADAVLIGGSGDYSAAGEGEWLERTFAVLCLIVDMRIPTFASCWGFQALARALGGRCVHDLPNAELGTIELRLTQAGREDPLFGSLPKRFAGHAGHEDHVVELPPGAILLASSEKVAHQAFKLDGKPIYCTQFHPELNRAAFIERIVSYPRYVETIARIPYEEFAERCRETPESNTLLKQFVRQFARGRIA